MSTLTVSLSLDTMISFVQYVESKGGGYGICDIDVILTLKKLRSGMSESMSSVEQTRMICPLIRTVPVFLESLMLHYNGSKIDPSHEIGNILGDYLLRTLGTCNIPNVQCCYFPSCEICSRVTSSDIAKKILENVTVSKLLLTYEKSDQLVNLLIQHSDESIASIIANPQSLYCVPILRSIINKDNQLICRHVKLGNIQAVRFALEAKSKEQYVVSILSESDPLIQSIRDSPYSSHLMKYLTRRPDFRAIITIKE